MATRIWRRHSKRQHLNVTSELLNFMIYAVCAVLYMRYQVSYFNMPEFNSTCVAQYKWRRTLIYAAGRRQSIEAVATEFYRALATKASCARAREGVGRRSWRECLWWAGGSWLVDVFVPTIPVSTFWSVRTCTAAGLRPLTSERGSIHSLRKSEDAIKLAALLLSCGHNFTSRGRWRRGCHFYQFIVAYIVYVLLIVAIICRSPEFELKLIRPLILSRALSL